ncbi:MAG: SIS domain-containing protein [Chloroflexota bacterium]|nr:SIS domain-containing protein [Chloroflexota bacterium]
MNAGKHTVQEIYSQPRVWADALAVFEAGESTFSDMIAAAEPDHVVVTGCGSTYYLSLTAARLLRGTGIDAQARPASELLLFPESIYLPGRKYALITVSRSGATTETRLAGSAFKARIGGPVITVTCDSGSPLARKSDLAFAIDSAGEKSVAQTRSFSSMCLVLQQMAAALAGHERTSSLRLPAQCQQLLDSFGDLAETLGADRGIERFFFLGADTLYGIACEAMLKMKEMSLSYSEAFHTLEFRHGPMSMAAENALVVGLISAEAARQELQVLREMRRLGAQTLSIAPFATDSPRHIALPDDLPVWNAPVLYLPVLQLLAYHRALRNGQNPDRPQNLSAVISLADL